MSFGTARAQNTKKVSYRPAPLLVRLSVHRIQTMMRIQLILITLLLRSMAGTLTQRAEDCPDQATECPDNCAGTQCPRFLNAECRENPCHGLCTPNFFRENGRNVTDRCDIERCSEKLCPGKRQCVEEIVPASCPKTKKGQCRQYIKSRCILPPPPTTDCSQITCGQDMYCREKRVGGVMCAQARNCFQLKCDEGFVCLEMEGGPMCTINKPTSCEEANCPEGTVCSEFNVPSRDIAIAQCLPKATADRLPVFGNQFSCSSGFPVCNKDTEVCTGIFLDGHRLTIGCNGVNCTTSDPTSCPHDRVCSEPPPDLVKMLQIPFTGTCTPRQFVYSRTCATTINPCPDNLACLDIVYENTTIGITCGIRAHSYASSSCAELGCPAPLECFERISKGRGGLAQCTNKEATDIVVETILRSISPF